MSKNEDALLSEIKQALASAGTEPTPENIASACCEAIVELDSRSQTEYGELLDIVMKFASSIKLSRDFVKTVSVAIGQHYGSVLCILKAYFRANHPSPVNLKAEGSEMLSLFQVLIKHSESKGMSNLVARHFDVRGYLEECSIEQKVNLLKNSLEIFGDQVDVVEFMAANRIESNALILSYLEHKSLCDDGVPCGKLREIIDLVSPEAPENLRILTHVLAFNRQNVVRSRLQSPSDRVECAGLFSGKLFDLVRYEVIDAQTHEKKLEELVSLLGDMILPNFIPLVREMNEKFLCSAQLSSLMRSIASYMKVEEFMDIIQPIDIRKHYRILKSISNVDLGVFIGLYKAYSRSTEFEQLDLDYTRAETFSCVSWSGDALDCLMVCLPSFCYYCSDCNNNIANVIKIFRAHLPTHRSSVCSAIERLVQSHSMNVCGTLLMGNPVERSESMRILDSIRQSGIFHELLQAFVKSRSTECDSALRLVADLCHADMSSSIIPVIMGDIEDPDLSVYDSLRLMPFFVKGRTFGFDFVSRLAELCCSAEVDVQKRAYYLLYCIYTSTDTDACICDILYSSMERSVSLPSEKNRIMLEYAILKRGCKRCSIEHKADVHSKFLAELVRSAKLGNAKCKKLVRDIVVEMVDSLQFRQFILSHMVKEITDPDLLCGCIECAGFMLDHMGSNQEYISSHGASECNRMFVQDLFGCLISVSLYSQDVAKHILKVFIASIKMKEYEAFVPGMLRIVDSYIPQFSKKYNRDLKNFCIAAGSMGHGLTRAMKTLLRFRNKSGRPKELLVVRKQEFGKMI